MKLAIKFFTTFLSLIIIFNCSIGKEKYTIEEIEGVKYIKNSGIPTAKYRPKTKFLFKITGPENVPDSMKGFGEILDIMSDFNDNIYILDGIHATIKKFNRNGEFERYFPEQRGSELAQFKKPSQFAAINDTIVIIDSDGKKYLRYLQNGSFINSSLRFMGGGTFLYLNSDGSTLTAFVPSSETIDSINYFTNNLTVLDNKFKPKSIIKYIKEPFDENFFFPDILTVYAAKKDMFYVAENKDSQYKIYVINGRGHLKYVFEKAYDKSAYNNYEKAYLNDFITSSGFPGIDTNKVYFKKAVNSIQIDKNDRVWTQPSIDRIEANQDSFYIDIFDKGIFVNRTVLDFVNGNESYKLIGNRLYVISGDRKLLKVYDYE